MASTSASRDNGAAGRIRTAASTLYSENQSLISGFRRALVMMKEIAVDFERDNLSGKVKELENTVAELLKSYEDCALYASVVESVGNKYQPGEELTDFKKLLEAEFVKLKAGSSSVPQDHLLMRQFREAVWNVHHTGQPMPGEEQEDIVMTSTQSNILNIKCPVSGKPITELAEPVCGAECKHIYEKQAILEYISKNAQAKCPESGCPRNLRAEKLVHDPLVVAEIEEMRSMGKEYARTNVVEDFTELDEEEAY